MYTGLDAVGVDQQPIQNYNEWRLLYFISFLLLVAFFVLNMFVGVVVENFHRCREEQEKEEKARRAAKRARKLEKKRRSIITLNGNVFDVEIESSTEELHEFISMMHEPSSTNILKQNIDFQTGSINCICNCFIYKFKTFNL